MRVNEAVRARRAIKWYDTEHQMPEETFRTLMEHAILSPTAFNIQNWRFVRVTEAEQRKAIRAVAWDQAHVTDASELLVLCFNNKAWERDPHRYWRNAPQEVQDFLVPAIDAYYRDKPLVERDEGMRSCGLVGQTIMLMAQELGYQSCPMDGFDFDAVAKIINLPEDHAIAFMIALGKGTKDSWPKPGQLDLDEVMVSNRFDRRNRLGIKGSVPSRSHWGYDSTIEISFFVAAVSNVPYMAGQKITIGARHDAFSLKQCFHP